MNSAVCARAVVIGGGCRWLDSLRSGLAAGPAGWRRRLGLGLTAALLLGSPLVRADDWAGYPQRPIKLLLGYPAGGGGDLLGRLFAARLGQELGQPVARGNTLYAVAEGELIVIGLTPKVLVRL